MFVSEKEKMRALRANSTTCSYQLQLPAIDRKEEKTLSTPRGAVLRVESVAATMHQEVTTVGAGNKRDVQLYIGKKVQWTISDAGCIDGKGSGWEKYG